MDSDLLRMFEVFFLSEHPDYYGTEWMGQERLGTSIIYITTRFEDSALPLVWFSPRHSQ